jgi:hypothetical protein
MFMAYLAVPAITELDSVTASCRLRKALISAAEWPDCMKNLNLKRQCHPSVPGAGTLQVQIDVRPSCRGTGPPHLVNAPVNRRI